MTGIRVWKVSTYADIRIEHLGVESLQDVWTVAFRTPCLQVASRHT
jgi:hypothetical protein